MLTLFPSVGTVGGNCADLHENRAFHVVAVIKIVHKMIIKLNVNVGSEILLPQIFSQFIKIMHFKCHFLTALDFKRNGSQIFFSANGLG